jgi:hypothetical protein
VPNNKSGLELTHTTTPNELQFIEAEVKKMITPVEEIEVATR